MKKETRLVSLDSHGSPDESFRGWPLLIPGLIGLVLVAGYLIIEDDPLGGLFLEVGAGLALFSTLFFFERRFVFRFVRSQIQSLREPMTREEIERNEATPGDFHGDFGPLFMASTFLGLVAEGRIEEAFPLMAPSLREVRAAAWLYNNREQLKIDELNRQEHIVRLASGPNGGHPHWQDFVDSEAAVFREATSQIDFESLSWSQRRRIVGPNHETVIAFQLGSDSPHGAVISGPYLVDGATTLLLEAVELDGTLTYLVAAFNSNCPPTPGWPPTLWIVDDPVAFDAHPGVKAEPIRASLEEE